MVAGNPCSLHLLRQYVQKRSCGQRWKSSVCGAGAPLPGAQYVDPRKGSGRLTCNFFLKMSQDVVQTTYNYTDIPRVPLLRLEFPMYLHRGLGLLWSLFGGGVDSSATMLACVNTSFSTYASVGFRIRYHKNKKGHKPSWHPSRAFIPPAARA